MSGTVYSNKYEVQELIAKGEAYANLYNAQFTGPRNGEAVALGAAAAGAG